MADRKDNHRPKYPTGVVGCSEQTSISIGSEAIRSRTPYQAKGAKPHSLSPIEEVVAVWTEVLGREVEHDVDFFDAGGDSVAAALMGVIWHRRFGQQLPAEAFLDQPTITTMAAKLMPAQGLLGKVQIAAQGDALNIFKVRQKYFLRNWEGTRLTREGLVVAPNALVQETTYKKQLRHPESPTVITKTFWICHHYEELWLIFQHLHEHAIVYGLRSGKFLFENTGNLFDGVVALYVEEILEAQSHGPYRIGGTCSASILAVAVARALQDKQEKVALLTIIDFDVVRALSSKPYIGPVALVVAQKSRFSPYRFFTSPLLGLRKLLPNGVLLQSVDVDYASVFLPDVAPQTILAIRRALEWSYTEIVEQMQVLPSVISDDMDYSADFNVPPLLKLTAGSTFALPFIVRNTGSTVWSPTVDSGIMVGNHWTDEFGRMIVWKDGTASFDEPVEPGQCVSQKLIVTVPSAPGLYLLEIDMVEQGVCWFKDKGVLSGYVEVHVLTLGRWLIHLLKQIMSRIKH